MDRSSQKSKLCFLGGFLTCLIIVIAIDSNNDISSTTDTETADEEYITLSDLCEFHHELDASLAKKIELQDRVHVLTEEASDIRHDLCGEIHSLLAPGKPGYDVAPGNASPPDRWEFIDHGYSREEYESPPTRRQLQEIRDRILETYVSGDDLRGANTEVIQSLHSIEETVLDTVRQYGEEI